MSRALDFVGRHASVIAVVVVAVIALAAIIGVRQEGDDRRAADVAAQRERQAQICESIEVNRDGLLDLIGVVLQDSSGPSGPPDLDAIPEFQEVDPEVQALIRVLVRPRGDNQDVIERLRGFRDGLQAAPLPDFCTGGPIS